MPKPKYILTAPAGDDPVARSIYGETVQVAVYDDEDLKERVTAAWLADVQVQVKVVGPGGELIDRTEMADELVRTLSTMEDPS